MWKRLVHWADCNWRAFIQLQGKSGRNIRTGGNDNSVWKWRGSFDDGKQHRIRTCFDHLDWESYKGSWLFLKDKIRHSLDQLLDAPRSENAFRRSEKFRSRKGRRTWSTQIFYWIKECLRKIKKLNFILTILFLINPNKPILTHLHISRVCFKT